MAVRLAALLPRLVILTVIWLLATATLTFAAEKRITSPKPHVPEASAAPRVIVVPDVTGQAYVFAKGMLEDAGFAWRVVGPVKGFAANLVAAETPAPGTRVVDTGAPTITIRLTRGHYPQKGEADDHASYAGTRIRLANLASSEAPAPRPLGKPKRPLPVHAEPSSKRPVKPAAPKAKPHVQARPPAFTLAGAPKEPLDEIPLPERASKLDAWVSGHKKLTKANAEHWLYQHAWIVAGAKFGWWHGAEALETLIETDRRVESQWGIGKRSEAVARGALASVRARMR